MLLITDGLLAKYVEANEQLQLDTFINKKLFNVSDTPLTYRQVNALDNDELLPDDRKGKPGWRKFSFKELIYVLIIGELKKFGMKHEQLKELWDAFFKEPTEKRFKQLERNKHDGEIAIGCVFGQVEIRLAVADSGEVLFYDPPHSLIIHPKSQITIVLNNIVNDLLIKTGKNPIPVRASVDALMTNGDTNITPKEQELMKIVRDKNFSAVRIKKKDGEIAMVYAEKVNGKENTITPKDLLKMIGEKDFQDVSIVKRNGKIVHCKVEEAIKL